MHPQPAENISSQPNDVPHPLLAAGGWMALMLALGTAYLMFQFAYRAWLLGLDGVRFAESGQLGSLIGLVIMGGLVGFTFATVRRRKAYR